MGFSNNRYPHGHLPYYCDHVYYWVMYVRGQISQQLWIDRAIALYPLFPAKTWCCETRRRVILLPTPTIIGTSWKLVTDKCPIRALFLHTFNVSNTGTFILYERMYDYHVRPMSFFLSFSVLFGYTNLDHPRSHKIEKKRKNGFGPFSCKFFGPIRVGLTNKLQTADSARYTIIFC